MLELKNCKKLLLEINQSCNLNCTYCFYRDYGKSSSSLRLRQVEEVIKRCPNAKEFYLTGGECFLSKEIESIIDLLYERGKIIAFTNGTVFASFNDEKILRIIKKVNKFIITFDSFDFSNFICRQKLDVTLKTITKICKIDPEKVEVKVCISNFNYNQLEDIFNRLIENGVKYLSVNFVFDIVNSKYKHEVIEKEKLIRIFETIYKYIEYFNKDYIDVLYKLYIDDTYDINFPCIADKEYYYYDCTGNFLICPGNFRKIGQRGDWKKCYSRECANEWEIMYLRR